MSILDVFNSDAFAVVPLTDTINKIKFVPSRIRQMGLFDEQGIATTTAGIEEQSGALSLISPTPRGGPGVTLDKERRKLRSILIPHFEINDAIMAEEVQGVRQWGTESQTQTVQGRVAERMARHSQDLEYTHEYSRIGAIKGTVTYADATTLNLFTLFDVSAQTEVDFDLDNASPASGALRLKAASVVRTITTALDGQMIGGVHAFCGDTFYDNLIAHPEVRDTYLGWAQAEELRTGYAYGAFPFGGIMWENYRGAVGGTAFVHTDKAHIFPVGVPGLFKTFYAPADYVETVNTIGQRLYAKQYRMLNDKGIHFDTQSNALHICMRPNALVPARRT